MFLEILEGLPIPQEQKDIDENDEPREPLLSYTFFWGGGVDCHIYPKCVTQNWGSSKSSILK